MLIFTNYVAAQKNANTLSKKIHNTYQVAPDNLFSLINKFGQVTINTWEKNEIDVTVEIKAWARNETDAQDLLDKISIDEKRKDKEIYYETKFVKKYKNSHRSGFEINYEVSMPTYLALNLENRFGATYVGDINGTTNIVSAYGSLKTKRLSGKEVSIKVSYGKADIDEIRYGHLKTSYCSYVNIEKAGDISVEDRNGRLEIEEVDAIEASSAYSSFGIGKLNKSLTLDSKFGSANIDDIDKNIKRIDIEIAYGSVNVDLKEVTDFDFDVEVDFGSFNPGFSKLNYRTLIERPTQKKYEGKKGNGGSPIKINASYGSVKF